MKNKLTNLKTYYKAHPKRFWLGGIVLVIILFVALSGGKKETITIFSPTATDLKETVLATGQVTSQVDLGLSFSMSDVVRSIPVKVGQKVFRGQTLASLDNRDEYASYAEAQASVKAAQARYKKVEDGASNEEVAVSQAALTAAQSDLSSKQRAQDTIVESARRSYLNADITPIATSGSSGTAPTISGTYTGTSEGEYTITAYTSGSGGYFAYSGLESGSGDINSGTAKPLGTKGLYIQFPAGFSVTGGNTWKVSLPNKTSANYLSKLNAYEEAQQNRDSVLDAARSIVAQREADLALRKAAARPADLDAAQADILSAQARLATASVAYENTILRAPSNGTITRIDIKIGERVDAQKQIMVLQDVSDLYVEASINEANIARLKMDQTTTMTLDAFGPTTYFNGKIVHIDPSATTDDGIVNYKVKSSIGDSEQKTLVRPGMNANITIDIAQKAGVIAVPEAAITQKDGKFYVNVVTNEKRKKYEEREIITGIRGDGLLIEVVSGLSSSEKIAIIEKN